MQVRCEIFILTQDCTSNFKLMIEMNIDAMRKICSFENIFELNKSSEERERYVSEVHRYFKSPCEPTETLFVKRHSAGVFAYVRSRVIVCAVLKRNRVRHESLSQLSSLFPVGSQDVLKRETEKKIEKEREREIFSELTSS